MINFVRRRKTDFRLRRNGRGRRRNSAFRSCRSWPSDKLNARQRLKKSFVLSVRKLPNVHQQPRPQRANSSPDISVELKLLPQVLQPRYDLPLEHTDWI